MVSVRARPFQNLRGPVLTFSRTYGPYSGTRLKMFGNPLPPTPTTTTPPSPVVYQPTYYLMIPN